MYSVGIAYLLWFLSGFGAAGFHRFYLGKIPSGLLWMFSGGLMMIGSIYDFFTLPAQVREANIRNALLHGAAMGGRNWRHADDARFQFVHERKESVERIILKIAKRNKGIVTASEAALEANIPMEEAKKALDVLVDKGFAEIRVRKSGVIVYVLPELMDSESPLENF
jgi:TM2 domain-containing membrane protein YozV/predicted transcriptional regulator